MAKVCGFYLFFVIVRVGGFGVARARRGNFGTMGGVNISGKREEKNWCWLKYLEMGIITKI